MAKTTPAQRFARIFAIWVDKNAPAGERAAAERKLDAWLKQHGKSRADIGAILAQAAADDVAAQPTAPPSDPRDADPTDPLNAKVTPLDLIRALLEDYAAMSTHELVAAALWAAHTHVFDRFEVTPRLVLTSPVRGCGKSVVLNVLSRLVARPDLIDNITAAGLYDVIDRSRPTALLDEADNLEVGAKAALRAVLNSGHLRGRSVRRGVGKQARRYFTHAPIALAAIGVLTPTLMSRSIVIHMTRHDGSRPLRRFVEGDTQNLDIAYRHTRQWARNVMLNPDPTLPAELHNRVADNWRPLISIADACGPAWGALAREAAIALTRGRRDEDIVVVLLHAIRDVFDATAADRLAGKEIVTALHAMEDGGWDAWGGEHGDRPPHRITNAELAHVLRQRFGIRSRSIWPTGPRHPGATSAKGYWRSDFETAWAAYCQRAGTPAQRRLRTVGQER